MDCEYLGLSTPRLRTLFQNNFGGRDGSSLSFRNSVFLARISALVLFLYFLYEFHAESFLFFLHCSYKLFLTLIEILISLLIHGGSLLLRFTLNKGTVASKSFKTFLLNISTCSVELQELKTLENGKDYTLSLKLSKFMFSKSL